MDVDLIFRIVAILWIAAIRNEKAERTIILGQGAETWTWI